MRSPFRVPRAYVKQTPRPAIKAAALPSGQILLTERRIGRSRSFSPLAVSFRTLGLEMFSFAIATASS
jgi:hypothetical protein